MSTQPASKAGNPKRMPAKERAWLSDLTTTITAVTRTTHSMRLYDAMGERAGLGIRPYLFGVLSRIKDLQPVRVSEVADQMDYDRSTVSRHVAELTSLGCVERQADEGDGRAVILQLTEKGEDAVAKVFEAWMDFLRSATADWSAGERAQFLELLGRFGTAIDERVTEL